MTPAQITYNPGILGETELVRSFVVRQKSLELILEAIRENSTAAANRHLLIIGPRGIGKTMLVRRAAAAVQSNPEYSKHWYPLVFGEESYPVSTAGEFWLEAIFHLADQTGEDRLQKAFAELRDERDDTRLRDRALSQLLDFADRGHTRILLVVENLNTLVGEQMEQDAAWELRHTLLNEPRLMLLGTATNRLDEIAHVGHAWFEMFSVHQLQPLSVDECGELWRSVTGNTISTEPLKAIRILTGGNPRLLKILATFAANHSFRELMEQLVHLIDDHTEYFKGHLDALAVKERKVFVALLERWDPVRAADLAKHTRLTASEVSALLGRLGSRGAVEVVEQRGRKKLYQASERLYNIYYLMRRRGHPEGRVQAAVQFMITFYKNQELVDRLAELAKEACALPIATRQDYYRTYIEVLRRVEPIMPEVLMATPVEFLHAADIEMAHVIGKTDLAIKVTTLANEGKVEDAEKLCRHFLEFDHKNPHLWFALGMILGRQRHWAEAEDVLKNVDWRSDMFPSAYLTFGAAQLMNKHFVEAEEIFRHGIRTHPMPDSWLGLACAVFNQDRFSEAVDALLHCLELDRNSDAAWEMLAHAYHEVSRLSEAENAIREAIKLAPTAQRWKKLGSILRDQNRLDELKQAYQNATQLDPIDDGSWGQLGRANYLLGHMEEAEKAFRRAAELNPNVGSYWSAIGAVLFMQNRGAEAETFIRKGVELAPEDPIAWRLLGLMLQAIDSSESAEAVWTEALQRHGKLLPYSVNLLELRHKRGVAPETLLHEAKEWLLRSKDDPEALVAIVKFITANLENGLPVAERWARNAFEKHNDFSNSEALITVLAKLGKWQEAFSVSSPLLNKAAEDEKALESATNFMVRAAAKGFGKEALHALKTSKGVSALEPLIVGLQIYLGEKPTIAKEIMEIGNDVADRIRKCAGEMSEEAVQ